MCIEIGISDSLNTICSYVHCVLQDWSLISVFTNIYRTLFTHLLTITKLLLLRMFLFPSESSFWVLLFLSPWLVCIPFTFQTYPISSQVIYKESQWPSTVQLLYKLSWQNCGLYGRGKVEESGSLDEGAASPELRFGQYIVCRAKLHPYTPLAAQNLGWLCHHIFVNSFVLTLGSILL